MPEVSLIDTADIPTVGRGGGGARTQLAEETLRRALQQVKSVRVILSADDRASGVYGAYQAAWQRLGIGLATTYGPRRPYTNARGKEAFEPSVLYFTVKKAPPATNGHMRPPVKVGEAQTTLVRPGLEVTR